MEKRCVVIGSLSKKDYFFAKQDCNDEMEGYMPGNVLCTASSPLEREKEGEAQDDFIP